MASICEAGLEIVSLRLFAIYLMAIQARQSETFGMFYSSLALAHICYPGIF
jgi:hypothetical protein